MTENEAIRELHNIRPRGGIIPQKRAEALDVAIKTLEEIQQYRAIGTVEQLQELKEKLQGYKNQMSIYAEQHKIILAIDVLDMLEEIDWQ